MYFLMFIFLNYLLVICEIYILYVWSEIFITFTAHVFVLKWITRRDGSLGAGATHRRNRVKCCIISLIW